MWRVVIEIELFAAKVKMLKPFPKFWQSLELSIGAMIEPSLKVSAEKSHCKLLS